VINSAKWPPERPLRAVDHGRWGWAGPPDAPGV